LRYVYFFVKMEGLETPCEKNIFTSHI
jgi:hypothetical protein